MRSVFARCATLGLLLGLLAAGDGFCAAPAPPPPPAWKVGVAAAQITPRQSMWMAGYAGRKKPSEGTLQDLFAKALAIEDSQGKRVVILTLDLIGVLPTLRESVEKQLQEKHGLPPAALVMCASHTHSGPEYRPRKDRESEAANYHKFLEDTLVRLADEALSSLTPTYLTHGHARAGFAMNRRRNYTLAKTDPNANKAPNPDGVVDHDVPVLCATDTNGQVKAVLFGYACHNTCLGFYEFCGDYAGYAQEYFQQGRPGATALYFLGCGADQNPYPRSKVELAKQHGRNLATAVEAALFAPTRPVTGGLAFAMERIPLKKAEDRPEPLSYPVQVIRLGNEILWVTLASEVVVDYSLRLKRELAKEGAIWVAGYSNGYFGYIPSDRIFDEGGYEADGWKFKIEERIVGKVKELVKATGKR